MGSPPTGGRAALRERAREGAIERVTITACRWFVYDDTGPTVATEILEYDC